MICPLCNGFQNVDVKCQRCQTLLTDSGKVTDFFGPYSAYEEYETLGRIEDDEAMEENCIHCFFCPACGNLQQVTIFKG